MGDGKLVSATSHSSNMRSLRKTCANYDATIEPIQRSQKVKHFPVTKKGKGCLHEYSVQESLQVVECNSFVGLLRPACCIQCGSPFIFYQTCQAFSPPMFLDHGGVEVGIKGDARGRTSQEIALREHNK